MSIIIELPSLEEGFKKMQQIMRDHDSRLCLCTGGCGVPGCPGEQKPTVKRVWTAQLSNAMVTDEDDFI